MSYLVDGCTTQVKRMLLKLDHIPGDGGEDTKQMKPLSGVNPANTAAVLSSHEFTLRTSFTQRFGHDVLIVRLALSRE